MTDGPWTVQHENGLWVIRNPKYKRPRRIGPAGRDPRCQSKVNYRERAEEEAEKRNKALADKAAM